MAAGLRPFRFWLFLLFMLAGTPVLAGEWQLVYRYGQPMKDRQKAWNGHVEHASWISDDTIAFSTIARMVSCIQVGDDKPLWSHDQPQQLRGWSVSRKTNRIAILDSDHRVSVLDARRGRELFEADREELARLLKVDFVIPSQIALSPEDGSLYLCDYSRSYGRNGYVLDPICQRLERTFPIDASPRELSVTQAGTRLAVIAEKEVLCVYDLAKDRDVFLRGERIKKAPETHSFVIDAPFFSHIRHDGHNAIVFTQDNSWATGTVHVHDLASKKTQSFDARNGHIEMDVNFGKRRVALTGTSCGLTMLDFTGKVLANQKDITLQRNACIEFSPSGDRVLVGSWDNTLSVYKFVE